MGRPRKTDRLELDDYGDEVADDRNDRDQDRSAFEREMFADASESPLFIPPEDWPDGKTPYWVRIEAANAPDNANWSVKVRQGYEPVMRGKYPKIDRRFPSIPIPGMEEKSSNSAIIFGGLCLCMRDTRRQAAARQAQQKETADTLRTVETYVEGGTSAVPRFSQSSPVQFERGRAPAQFKE